MKKTIVLILTGLLMTACGTNGAAPAAEAVSGPQVLPVAAPVEESAWDHETPAIKSFLLTQDSELQNLENDPQALAVRLMDDLNRVNVLWNSNLYAETRLSNIVRVFTDSAHYGHICGGMALTFVDMLEAFGIVSRFVGLYSVDGHYTHAVVEVFLDGHWDSFDPTYNMRHVDDQNRPLSFQEMKDNGFQYQNILGESGSKTPLPAYDFYNNYFGRIDPALPGSDWQGSNR